MAHVREYIGKTLIAEYNHARYEGKILNIVYNNLGYFNIELEGYPGVKIGLGETNLLTLCLDKRLTTDYGKFEIKEQPVTPEPKQELGFNYNDGGRSKYYKATNVGDCVTRALAIATGMDYKVVYGLVRLANGGTPRNGVSKKATKAVAERLGGKWFPLMRIGSGCTAHLVAGEIPTDGNIVCQLSHHLTAVIDGVVNDTYDCTREGNRCVYGYWRFK